MAKKLDALSELNFLRWGSLVLPCTKFSTGFSQDIAAHKYYRRDGQNLEATGRSGFEFTFTIPFIRGLRQARGERWTVTPLYPQGLKAFIATCQDGKTQILGHPELGDYNCKVSHIHWDTAAERRNGVFLDVSWAEDNTANEGKNLVTADNAGNATAPAEDINRAEIELAKLRALNVKVPKLPKAATLTTLARQVVASRDRIGRLSQDSIGQVDRLVRNVRDIEQAIVGTPSVLSWPARQSATKTENALINARADISRGFREVKKYRTAIRMSLSNVARILGVATQDLIELNPQLLSSPMVPADTVVRYHP